MTALMLNINMGMQERFAPLPFKLHLIFCLAATVLFVLIYKRYHKVKDVLWLISCDLTFILQFYSDKRTALVIGVCEVILLAMIFVEYCRELKEKIAKKAAEAAAEADAENSDEPDAQDNLEDVAKAVKLERAKLAPDSGEDVISRAFDSEDIDK